MVRAEDWRAMSRSLSPGYTEAQVRKLFFSGEDQAREQNQSSNVPFTPAPSTTTRKPGFLTTLSSQAYDRVCQHIIEHPSLHFLDISQFLRLKRDDTRIMAQVLAHVVGWLNPSPTEAVRQQESTKPLLRKHMVPILEGYAPITTTGINLDNNGGEDVDLLPYSNQAVSEDSERARGVEAAAWAEQRSVVLEQRVLDFVREHMTASRDPSNKLYLELLPEEAGEGYELRFVEEIWKGLDNLVREVVASPQYRPSWKPIDAAAGTASPNDTGNGATSKGRKPVSNITRALCSRLQTIPEVKESPVLKGDASSIELAAIIDRAVLEWAAKKCRKALSTKETDDGRPLSAEEIRQIKSDQEKYEELVRGLHEDSAPASAQPHRAISVSRASEPDLEAESQMAGAAADKQDEVNRHAIRRPLPSARVIAASSPSSRPSKEKPKTPQVSRHGPSRAHNTSLASNRRHQSTGQNRQKLSQQAAPVSDTSARKPAWASGVAATSGKCK